MLLRNTIQRNLFWCHSFPLLPLCSGTSTWQVMTIFVLLHVYSPQWYLFFKVCDPIPCPNISKYIYGVHCLNVLALAVRSFTAGILNSVHPGCTDTLSYPHPPAIFLWVIQTFLSRGLFICKRIPVDITNYKK